MKKVDWIDVKLTADERNALAVRIADILVSRQDTPEQQKCFQLDKELDLLLVIWRNQK